MGSPIEDLKSPVDVIVVGSGVAGVSAAIEAAVKGLEVVVLEAQNTLGGASIISGGACCFVGTSLQQEQKVQDSVELAFSDWIKFGGPTADVAWARKYLENSRVEVCGWLEDMGVRWKTLMQPEGNSVPRWHLPEGWGQAIMSRLIERAKMLGVDFKTHACVERLIVENENVKGVELLFHDSAHTLLATNVIVSTGGFSGNIAKVMDWAPCLRNVSRVLSGGSSAAKGLGHEMLLRDAGADLVCLDHIWVYPVGTPDPTDPDGKRGLGVRGFRREIWLNSEGRRFHNEQLKGPRSGTPALLSQPGQTLWVVFPQSDIDDLEIINNPAFFPPQLAGHTPAAVKNFWTDSDYAWLAQDIDELSQAIGLPADNVRETISAFNADITAGSIRTTTQPESTVERPSLEASALQSNESDLAERVRRLEQALFATGDQRQPRRDTADRQSDWELSTSEDHVHFPAQGQSDHEADARQSPEIAEYHAPGTENEYLLLGTAPQYKPLPIAELVQILPTRTKARKLFRFYVDNVNWDQHIVHVPTTARDLELIYDQLAEGMKPEGFRLALIAAIFAVAAYFWPEPPPSEPTLQDPKSCCRKWILLIQHALMESNHLNFPTLETLQAKMLLTHFLPIFPQTTGRRSYQTQLVNAAHMLQIHLVDSPRERALRGKDTRDVIELEVKRRVWWNIVACDWMLSFMTGPQLGTYIIHPDQMNVEFPSNIDDKDITADGNHDEPVLGSPTEMTFTIAKIRVSTVIRELIDTANKAKVNVDELDYEQILVFDKKLNDVYDTLPPYFRYEDASRPYVQEIYTARPYLERQRNFLLFGLYIRLSLLHRPFLTRSYKEPRYRYSRMVCLRSARIVIELQKAMREVSSGRMWLVMYHVFVATTTLVMDYACQRDDPQAATERKQEILNCYRILEEVEERDPEVKEGLATLKRITNEWRMRSDSALYGSMAKRLPDEVSRMASNPSRPRSEIHHQSQPQIQGHPQHTHHAMRQTPNGKRTTAATATAMMRPPTATSCDPYLSGVSEATNSNDITNLVSDRSNWSLDTTPPQYIASDIHHSGPEIDAGLGCGGPPVPDLWFPHFDADLDSTYGLQWESLFRDLENQQAPFGL
ncbi:Fungal specific transcription factor domain-containing protein [Cladophialophora immunda]|nr:Fungal specific transcription factor domain-containing protein [Cladophialophora immunda]